MKPLLLAALCSIALCGCVYQELTATHIMAGGKVNAQIGSSVVHQSTGLADGHNDPLSLNGFSADLTFGLVAADDTAGSTAFLDLAMENTMVDLVISPQGRTRLEVHLEGSGCLAQSGTIHLVSDADKNLGGSFQATGFVSGGTAPCTLSGTLSGIPVDR